MGPYSRGTSACRLADAVRLAALLALGLASTLLPATAGAATIAVTSTSPGVDPSDGACSLREAITAAGTDRSFGLTGGECAAGHGADTIVLARRATYGVSVVDNVYEGPNALPQIASDVTIRGDGAVIERAPGAPPMRRLPVLGGHVKLVGLTLRGGRASGTDGGRGGAVYSRGVLTLESATLSNNVATGEEVFGKALQTSAGGALFNDHGTLVVLNSTLSANAAGGIGGAVLNLDGPAVIVNSTLVANQAADGGALYDLGADGDPLAASAPPASVTLFNSILAGTQLGAHDLVSDQPASLADGAANVQRAAVYASAPNIVQSSSVLGGGTIEGRPIVADPQLGPLAQHGDAGPPTMEPRPGSPALGAGISPGCPATDARGRARPLGACDLGAHEVDPPPFPRLPRPAPAAAAFQVLPPHSTTIAGLEHGAPASRYNPSGLSHCYELVPLRAPTTLRDATGNVVTRRDGGPFLTVQGIVAVTPFEAIQTPLGPEYQIWGPPSTPLTYSGGIMASALARPPAALSQAALARCRRGSGRRAPDLRRHGHAVTYRIEPRSISARIAYSGGPGLIPYQNYGRFYAQDLIKRARVRPALDYTPLAWTWVTAPERCRPANLRCHNQGGGIARAMLRAGTTFVLSDVRPIVSRSATDPHSWVNVVYGHVSTGSQDVYGWVVAAHHDARSGRTIRHLACVRC